MSLNQECTVLSACVERERGGLRAQCSWSGQALSSCSVFQVGRVELTFDGWILSASGFRMASPETLDLCHQAPASASTLCITGVHLDLRGRSHIARKMCLLGPHARKASDL